METFEPLMLWLPVNHNEPDESDELIQKVTLANDAVMDFCDRSLSFGEMLEIVDDCGTDTDFYLANLKESIRLLGG